MLEFSKRIDNKIGLHLRAAGEFVKVAAQFASEVTVYNGDKWANGKNSEEDALSQIKQMIHATFKIPAESISIAVAPN